MSLTTELIRFAADEGVQSAIDKAQDWQSALEEMIEVAAPNQKAHALALLSDVNFSINEILKTNAVAIATHFNNKEIQ